jgi:hypothetical protein
MTTITAAARYGYKVAVAIWEGLRTGLDQIGPAGILALTALILALLAIAGH